MGIEIEKMDAEKWQAYVKNEFEKLLRCKRGQLSTEQTNMQGPKPVYSGEDAMKIIKNNQFQIIADLNQVVDEVLNQHDLAQVWDSGDIDSIVENDIDLASVFRNAITKLLVHPQMKAWEKKCAKIREQFRVRETVMEKQAGHTVRNFCTGVLTPDRLNVELDAFEATSF